MKIFIISIFFSICATVSHAQFNPPGWEKGKGKFSAVKMKVTDSKKKVLFDGFKNSVIEISSFGDPKLTSVSIDLGGYYKNSKPLEFFSCRYERKENLDVITYTFGDLSNTKGEHFMIFFFYEPGLYEKPMDIRLNVRRADKTELEFTLTDFD